MIKIALPVADLCYKYSDLKMSLESVALDYGCSWSTIQARLLGYGVPLRENERKFNMTKETLQYDYWDCGLSISDISQKYGCSGRLIYKRFIEYGIRRRSQKEACKMPIAILKVQRGHGRLGMPRTQAEKEHLRRLYKKTRTTRAYREEVSRQQKVYYSEHPERCEYTRSYMRAKWGNKEWRDKMVKALLVGLRIRPNGYERELLRVLNTFYPNEWEYVGNGQLIIGGKCPDFVNINGKKQIIEVFGEYWHKEEEE